MYRSLLTLCTASLLLTGCIDYTPTPKSMVSMQERSFHYTLAESSNEIEPYAWEELENALKSLPLKYIDKAEIITNRSNFIHTKGYEQIELALWRKGLASGQVLYSAYDLKEEPAATRVTLHYKGISYPKRCTDWRHSAVANHDNSVMSNFGCASTVNLGHMVADQSHLMESVGNHRTEMNSAISAVERYHSGEFVQQANGNAEAVSK